MPEIHILDPNDQPTGKWRLINELRKCLEDPDFDRLLVAVAFAKTGPLYRLHKEIQAWRERKKAIEGIFGINHRGTSRQALEFAMDTFSQIRLLHFGERFTFHPKMYLFLGNRRCRFFIGSHNLTVGGTETNWESGAIIDLILPNDEALFRETLTAWESLLALTVELTPELLAHYDGIGKLLDETPPLPPGVVWPKLVVKPPSPIPKSVFATNAKSATAKTRSSAKDQRTHSPSAEALVIQIVPHHNGEVFLSKIALNQNPRFFGYPFTGRATPKKAGNASYPQRTPDPIIDLTVHGSDAMPLVHLPRFALNTVFYEAKAEIRVTVPPEVVKNAPAFSILVMRQAPPDSDYDYDFDIFPPDHPSFESYLAACNQTLPSGGKESARRMGWF